MTSKTDKRWYTIGQQRAIAAVTKAVKSGDLPHISTHSCVDCGNPAKAYDHRDYNKPLEVEPVCVRCNCRRGKAIPLVIGEHEKLPPTLETNKSKILQVRLDKADKDKLRQLAANSRVSISEWLRREIITAEL